MSRTITALFDTKADADAGAERLRQAGIATGHVNVHDQSSHETTGAATTADRGLWASIKGAFVPHEDRHTYEEGLRRGGFLLTANVDEDNTPTAVAALEDANSVDIDARAQQWRADGWDHAATRGDDVEATAYGSRDPAIGGTRFRSYVADRG